MELQTKLQQVGQLEMVAVIIITTMEQLQEIIIVEMIKSRLTLTLIVLSMTALQSLVMLRARKY